MLSVTVCMLHCTPLLDPQSRGTDGEEFTAVLAIIVLKLVREVSGRDFQPMLRLPRESHPEEHKLLQQTMEHLWSMAQ